MGSTLELITGAITAMGALGLAAYALVDALKALPGGGIANVGVRHILEGCMPFASALRNGAGRPFETVDGVRGPAVWQELLRAQWRNGREKDAQKALVRSLVRQGLTEGDTDDVARFCSVDAAKLNALITKLKAGGDPTTEEGNMLGRIDAVIGFQIDAAYERADQRYRNVARVSAGALAILLGVAGAFLIDVGCPTPAELDAKTTVAVASTNTAATTTVAVSAPPAAAAPAAGPAPAAATPPPAATATPAPAVAPAAAPAPAAVVTASAAAPATAQAAAVCAYKPFGDIWWRTLLLGIAAGILAVPVAPIAKDLTSSLSAAVTAVKAVRGR